MGCTPGCTSVGSRARRLLPERVDDPADERVRDYVALSDVDHRRDGEIYIVEGEIALRRVAASGATFRSILVSEKKAGRVAGVAAGTRTFVASQPVLDDVVGYHLHRGVVAAAYRPPVRAASELLGPRVVAVLEGITDHENLGVIFRSAAALGVGTVFLSPSCCDPYYRRSVRVSQGNVAAVPFARLAPWPSSMDVLREAGYRIAALTPVGGVALSDAGLQEARHVAVVLGTEGDGLTEAAMERADLRVAIPMQPGVDSLNVATAAAIAFYEAGSARRASAGR